MIQKHGQSYSRMFTIGILSGLVSAISIGCTSSTVSSVQSSPQSKSQDAITLDVSKGNEKEPIESSEKVVSLKNPEDLSESIVADQIEDGRYWMGHTGQGLEVEGNRYRYDTESGSQPWKNSSDLKYVRNGVVFDGRNYWCLSTLAPKNKVSSCTAEGWKVAKAAVPTEPAPAKVAVLPVRQQTQPETSAYPEIYEEMHYGTFRQAAADKGWKPNVSPNCTANVNPGSSLCQQLPELQSCDKYSCQVVFNRVRSGKLITLKIFGADDGQVLSRGSKWRVLSWSIDDDNSQP